MAAGSTVLETSPLILAALLSIFIVLCYIVETALHKLEHYLMGQYRFGMVTALSNMRNELMLLGMASLILLACEDELSRICGEPRLHAGPAPCLPLPLALAARAFPVPTRNTALNSVLWLPQCAAAPCLPTWSASGWTGWSRAPAAWAPRAA
jgi:hypothetical protein